MNVISKVIELKDIHKSYRIGDSEFTVLKGIDLQIEEGEFIALMGPSGSGKSTLLNIVGCLDRPTSGQFLLLGQEISQTSDDELARVRREELGFIFQTSNLIGRISVLKNVEIPMMLSGVTREKRKERALKLLESVGIAHRSNFSPQNISGGERQRVAIARALAKRPKLLLCDEPTGALDYNTGKNILKLLHETSRKEKMTVILIAHNQAITPMADKVIIMKNGQVQKSYLNEKPLSVDEIEW